MERNYFRWMGCYDTEAGGRQTTTWYCDDETARGECQANEELLPGDVLFVAEGGEVYTVNSKRKVVPV